MKPKNSPEIPVDYHQSTFLSVLNCYSNAMKVAEFLESQLYKVENSVAKKKFIDKVFLPFKINSIKSDIKRNNKEVLQQFRGLGKIYTSINELTQKESRESLKELVGEYKSLFKLLNETSSPKIKL